MNRSRFIDCIKGIAILAVVFYHAGFCRYGYWGVDVFFVIAGYLTTRSILKGLNQKAFNYWKFLLRRSLRICPLCFLVSLVAMLVGLIVMLPDDLENLGESVVATNVFANNILQCITTKNYWDVVNDYKPLLHTWYLGVLFHFYVIYSIVFVMLFKAFRGSKKGMVAAVAILTVVSFCLYVTAAKAPRFYYFPHRFFEFGIGGILALVVPKNNLIERLRLGWLFNNKIIATIGLASFSIYLCHQPILAYIRYVVTSEISLGVLAAYLGVTALVSWLAFRSFEAKDGLFVRSAKAALVLGVVCLFIGTAIGLFVYHRNGVIRDVPELEISCKHIEPGMHKRYNSRIYAEDKPFPDNGKINVLCYGDSFARDFANVLWESSVSNRINLSYVFFDRFPEDFEDRLNNARYIFVGGGGGVEKIPGCLHPERHLKKIYVTGLKCFGESNGVAYNRRWSENYYGQTYKIPEKMRTQNLECKKRFAENYIDIIGVLELRQGGVPVFTDDKKLISQDCRHLTHAGAIFLAKKLEGRIKEIFK